LKDAALPGSLLDAFDGGSPSQKVSSLGRSDDLVAGLFLDSLEVFEKSALCVGCHL
jgi:hypothetical protein